MSSDITTSGSTIWTNAEADEEDPTLIYLKPDALCYAVIPVAELVKTVDQLRAGNDVTAQNIPLSAITEVTGTVGGCDLEVHYTQAGSSAKPVSLPLTDVASRDQLVDALAGRLGPRWQREEKTGSRLYNALWPAILTAAVVLGTWFMYWEAQEIAAGRQLAVRGHGKVQLISRVMHFVEGLIGATGVLILGGAVTLALLYWTCSCLVFPPRYFTLRPE
jgi:hypothetical protein